MDAATVSDVLDGLGYQHQGLAGTFAPYPETAGKLAGWAYTICGEMRPYAGGGDPDKMKAVDGLKPGCVSVWSGQGDGVCFFGELIALGMKTRGCAGALVDGGIRDIEWIAKQKFPVYARYRTPVQSIGRWKVTAWQVPAYLPGATKQHVIVNPGDFVLGDVDGVDRRSGRCGREGAQRGRTAHRDRGEDPRRAGRRRDAGAGAREVRPRLKAVIVSDGE